MNEQKRYAYITYQDLRSVPEYNSQTVMVIKAPPESKLHVPLPSKQPQLISQNSSSKTVIYIFIYIYFFFLSYISCL